MFGGGNPISRIELNGHYAIEQDSDRFAPHDTPTITSPTTTGSTTSGTTGGSTTPVPNTVGQQANEPVARPNPDRFFEMAGCNGGPGCVMPEGFVGKYGPYKPIPGEQYMPDLVLSMVLMLAGPEAELAMFGRAGSLIKIGTRGPRVAAEAEATAEGAVPRFITTSRGVTIDRTAVNKSISLQRQGRHVLGARQYGGGSYLNSADDAQRVLDDFHNGAAEILGVKGNDIVVRAPNVTGINVNPGSGYPSQMTNVFFIKGTSSPSVVPFNPAWTP
jgi:hypothetical protein